MTEQRAQRYRAGGSHEVLGHKPGTEFEAALSPEQEARLIERGSLTKVGEKKAGANEKEH